MHKQAEKKLELLVSALGCALDEGRAAIGMGRKTGNGEHNRNKLDLMVAHYRWGKIRIGGNCCSAPQMARSAAIHGALSIIGCRGKSRFRFWSGRGFWSGHAVVMMLMHGAITVVHCHGVA